MTMETEGSSSSSERLHNFTLPNGLRWGNQKFLKCRKVNADGHISAVKSNPTSTYSSFGGGGGGGGSSSLADGNSQMIRSQTVKGNPSRSDNHLCCLNDSSNKKRKMCYSFKPPLPSEKRLRMTVSGGEDDVNGIAAVRKKVILDFRNKADKMKDEILRNDNFGDDVSKKIAVEEGVRPWNLRIRRAVLKFEGCGIGGAVVGSGDQENNLDITSPVTTTTPRGRNTPAVTATASPRAKFSVPLTRREIEEDFVAMIRRKPNRRPKKRAKCAQKTIDTLFPGLWLSEITADIYKLPETQ